MLLSFIVYELFFFFFKQKTAYEVRISDWSSDVCSSDLPRLTVLQALAIGHDDLPVANDDTRDLRWPIHIVLELVIAQPCPVDHAPHMPNICYGHFRAGNCHVIDIDRQRVALGRAERRDLDRTNID